MGQRAGPIQLDQSEIAYGGATLAPDQQFRWTVQTWDGAGGHSPDLGAGQLRHRPRAITTGRADWITRASSDPLDATDDYTYARQRLPVGSSPVVRAIAYVSADQQYQLHLDGHTVDAGEAYSYPDTQYYQATDVTRLVRPGATLAVGPARPLGRGWARGARPESPA